MTGKEEAVGRRPLLPVFELAEAEHRDSLLSAAHYSGEVGRTVSQEPSNILLELLLFSRFFRAAS